MTYIHKNYKIPYQLKKSSKLSNKEKTQIKKEYKPNIISYQNLANKYNVSKRLIMFVVNPDKLLKCKEQFKIRQKEGRYKYTKEKRNSIMKKHRRYKQTLYLNKQLIKK